MIIRAQHLQDDTLFDCYYAARRGEALDPPSAEHLTDCESCSRRYADIGTFLNTISEEADGDVNAFFPVERLVGQQQEIARRLELVGRAARVITFPGRAGGAAGPASAVAQRERTRGSRLTSRWVAAVAAAGLFVGVAAGTVFNFGSRFDFVRESRRAGVKVAGRQTMTSTAPGRMPSPAVEQAVDEMDDLLDLESVVDRPQTRELVAFDALTPRVREIRDSAR